MRQGLFYAIIFSFCCLTSAQAYIVDGARVQRPKLLNFAQKQLSNKGVLERGANGLTYLKLNPNYIESLLKQTPGYVAEANQLHICVIDQDEGRNIPNIVEIGTTVSFRPLGFYKVVENDTEYFRLAIEAPELNSLRLKYGLSKQLEDKAFNLTIGIKKLDYASEMEP